MITDSFDIATPAIISPPRSGDRVHADACVMTFSSDAFDYAVEKYEAATLGMIRGIDLRNPVMIARHLGKDIAFFRSGIGAPSAVGMAEDATEFIDTKCFVLFGTCGSLDRDIPYGHVVIPTAAYRDEGTSYHYAAPADYIEFPNHHDVLSFMRDHDVPYAIGKTWTTDAFYRETRGNFDKRRSEGCICVDMESSAMQAFCQFREYQLLCFMYSDDLLDAPKWTDRRQVLDVYNNHNLKYNMFDLAMDLAAIF